MLHVASSLSPPCDAAAPGPCQRLGWSETGDAGLPGPQGLRTATVFGFEIQMTNTHYFPKKFATYTQLLKFPILKFLAWSSGL